MDGVLLDGLTFCKLADETLESNQAEPAGVAELRLLKSPRAKKLVRQGEWERAVEWLREAAHPVRFREVVLVEGLAIP